MATGGKITMPFRQITQLNLISFLRHNIRRPLSHDCLGPGDHLEHRATEFYFGSAMRNDVRYSDAPVSSYRRDDHRERSL
jgi:hypothetical protein